MRRLNQLDQRRAHYFSDCASASCPVRWHRYRSRLETTRHPTADFAKDIGSSTVTARRLHSRKLGTNASDFSSRPLPVVPCPLRDAGAMNSGPTGSLTDSRRIRSISDLAPASSRQPATSPTGSSWLGWRAPQSRGSDASTEHPADRQLKQHVCRNGSAPTDRAVARRQDIERNAGIAGRS